METRDSLAHQLLPILEPLQNKIKEWHCRIVPSAFDSHNESLRALPLARDWKLQSLEEHLRDFKPHTLILQLPSFWQIEPFIHVASRAAGAPVCIIEPQNFPLDKAAIRLASANAVLAESSEAATIAEYLVKENIELPPYWLLLHAGDASNWNTPATLASKYIKVAAEVHLAPGVPLLVQCKDIVAKNNTEKSALFHTSDVFTWNADLAAPTITTKEGMLCTLTNFLLPFKLQNVGTCSCGKSLLAREA